MGSRKEREFTFDCDGSTTLAPIDPVAIAYERDIRLSDVYWDTPDRRLLGRHITVRYRESSADPATSWAVELPVDRADGAGDRIEVTFGGRSDAPPDELLELVSATTRGDRIAPIATVDTARHVVGVRADDGRTTWGPELERVLGGTVARDVEIPELGPKSTVEDLVRHTFAKAVDAIIERDPAIRISDDPEAVHQARVATRELRSNLRTLRSVLLDEETDELRSELQWLGRTLGAARDLDVLEVTIRDLLPTVGVDASSPASIRLLGPLAGDRRRRRDELRAAMSGERYQELLRRLVAAAEAPVLRSDRTAGRNARTVIKPLAWDAWKRVARPLRGRQGGEPSDRSLHELRKRAKRARYAAELAARVSAGSSPAFAREMKRYQDSLGGLQDCVTAEHWLESVALGAPDPDVAFLAGKLSTRVEERQVAARARFDRRWNPKRASRLAAWFR